MKIRLDYPEPEHMYRLGGHVRSITQAGQAIGVAIRHRDGWEARLWDRPGKVRARWRLILVRRIEAALRTPSSWGHSHQNPS